MRLTTVILSGSLLIATVTSYKLYTYASQCTARIATLQTKIIILQTEKEDIEGKYDVALARLDSVRYVRAYITLAGEIDTIIGVPDTLLIVPPFVPTHGGN